MRLATVVLTLALPSATLPAQQFPSYSMTRTYPLGGIGGWHYVAPDPLKHRIYIARQTRVMGVDEDIGEVPGEVSDIHGAHGTIIGADTGHGFATSSDDESVVMFNPKTFKALGRIKTAEDADAAIFDLTSNRVSLMNGDANSSTVLNALTGTFIANRRVTAVNAMKPTFHLSANVSRVSLCF